MRKKILLSLLFSPLLILTSCSQGGGNIAEIDNIKISQKEFYNKLKEEAGKDVFEKLILEKFLTENYSVSRKELENYIEDFKIKKGFKNNKELKKSLNGNGLTMDEFKQNSKMKLLLEKAKTDGIQISEEDIKSEYEKIKNKTRVSHILVKDRDIAENIISEYQNGTEFEKLVGLYSIDEETKDNSGDLGYIDSGYMFENLESEIKSLDIGEISEPIKTSFGYHILLVTDKNRSYQEMKNDIKENLKRQRAKTTYEVIEDLLKNKNLKIKDQIIKESFLN